MQPSQRDFVADPDDIQTLSGIVHHQLTLLRRQSSRPRSATGGVTVWTTPSKDIVIFWDWSLSDEGVAVRTNPLEVRSNLVFARAGKVLEQADQRVCLSELVSLLPWQKWVKASTISA